MKVRDHQEHSGWVHRITKDQGRTGFPLADSSGMNRDPLLSLVEKVVTQLDPTGVALLIPVVYFRYKGFETSKDIECMLSRGGIFHWMFPKGLPTAKEIDSFRASHSKLIQHCLAETRINSMSDVQKKDSKILAELVLQVLRETGYSLQSLLGPIVFCCLKNIRSAGGISRFLKSDPTFRYLFIHEMPGARQVGQFFRDHETSINRCLALVRTRVRDSTNITFLTADSER